MAAATLAGAAPPKFQCATCHSDQARTQPLTSMGNALLAGANPRVLNGRQKLSVTKDRWLYTVEQRGNQITYSVSDGTASISVPVRWTVGANAHTWVLEYQGRLYESLVSFYPALNGLDTTNGDERLHPATLLEAMGRELTPQEQNKCFGCHAPAAVTGEELRLDAATTGLQCEHCHEGAAAHQEAISRGQAGVKPPNLHDLTPEQTSEFCGRCHRTWEDVMRGQFWGPSDVRFQPYRQANSKCYDGADRRLSCIACHDPHREVVRSAAAYDPRCLACHAASPTAKARSCPVANSGCTTCHMPKVDSPGMHQPFTDHQIRIVRAGEAYPD